MKSYVPIERRFAIAEKEELRDPDYLSYFGYEPEGVFKWPDLLKLAPVVVLGEGRSGKTREFQKQVEMLKGAGQFAFFIPLEALHDHTWEEALSIEDFEAFEEWKRSPNAVGYFFLDALDELKLREGSLRTAVNKLRRACRPHFAHLRLVLSCRPGDWKSQIDVQHLKPFSVQQKPEMQNVVTLESKAAFLEVISESEAALTQDSAVSESNDAKPAYIPTIVTILPLSQNEVREFSKDYAPAQADEFCAHIEAKDLWHLYRLPAEIIDTLDQLKAGEPLGTLEDQLRLGIQRKLREQQDKKRHDLSVDKALKGAERIALALFLLKRRTLKIEDTGDTDMLDIGDILTDWTQDEQQELLGKPLFDPSGVGSVRFHHRATQEYLAAKRLHRLRDGGMHERDLFALLFSEVGGEEVVKPSMAPVAAWLALWHPDIRKTVLTREPALLFSQGLPSALSLDIRAEVLRAYVSQYAEKSWCRAGVGHGQLKRVAHPDLAPVVRELWEDAYTGHDSRELVLEMIWLAPMPDCADLALETALDGELESDHRTYASWGVLASERSEQMRKLAAAVLDRTLPQHVIRNILPEMVPELIGTDTFLTLIDGLDVIPKSVHGLNYTIYQTVKGGEISRDALIIMRDQFAEAIWYTREDDCRMYQAESKKDHYQDGLLVCCHSTTPVGDEDPTAWARALTIAVHFGERHSSIIAEKETKALWEALAASPKLREAYFWACLDMADEIEEREDDWSRVIQATSDSRQSLRYDATDHTWLLNAVAPEAPENRRGVAFHAITQFFDLRQESKLAEALGACVNDRSEWSDTLHRILNPQPREPDKYDLKRQAPDKERKEKKIERISEWKAWRNEVLNAPEFLMGGERRLGVLFNAHKLIKKGTDRDSKWGHWDGAIIRRTMGDGFLKRYRQELSIFWREADVKLRSQRVPGDRGICQSGWLLALAAVKAEAETTDWAKSLSHDEAIRAARIACIELNGFGGFIATLDAAHPKAVANVVTKEILAELQQLPNTGQAEMFHDVLYHGTKNMKTAIATSIASRLSAITSLEQEGAKNILGYAIRIIAESGDAEARHLAIETLQQQFEEDNTLPKGFALSLLAKLDVEAGCRRLLTETENLILSQNRGQAIEVFAAVFGDRFSGRVPDLSTIPEDRRVPLLKDLVLRAYETVRRDEDIEHEGTFTPGPRDNAQDARSFLFDALLSIKRPDTLAALHDLAKRPEFGHMPDRLRQMAYEIAGQISDMTAHPLLAFQAMDRDGAFIPYDRRTLLTAIITRLDSFEHDVLHAEDTPIATLRKNEQETELRRYIANWLRGRDRDVFNFTQEAVVFDENRTDIRFHPRVMQGYGTVELKRETWSVRQYEKALRTQLVGQYLRHERCRVGCLLICQAQEKHWRHPDTNVLMTLQDVVIYLQNIAQEIMADQPELHILVKGIDYS